MENVTEKEFKINATLKVSHKRIEDLLCTAFEGGSNYWYVIKEYIIPKGINKQSIKFQHIEVPLLKGGEIIIGDFIDDNSKRNNVKLETIEKGLKIFAKNYPEQMNDFLNENEDSITADCFLQCVVFGDVIYG